MKRFAVCLLVVAFLLAGCAMGLTPLKSNQDIFSTLRGIAMKAPVNEDGCRWLEARINEDGQEIIYSIAYWPPESGQHECVIIVKFLGESDPKPEMAAYCYVCKKYYKNIATPFGIMAIDLTEEEAIVIANKLLSEMRAKKLFDSLT